MHPESQMVDCILARAQTAGRRILTEFESKQILAAYGIPTVKSVLASTAEEAVCAANDLGYPVVVKINSDTITHKTDVGGVKLNLNSPEQVREAFVSIQYAVESNFEKSDFQGVTVQPQVDARDAYELIVGASPDEQFGPVILFGSGGTFVEVYGDKALALPPLNSNLAHLMMKNTLVYKALKGVRGKGAVDMNALEKLIVNFSHLVIEQWKYISDVEINPLLASGDTLVALDARIILHPSEENGTAISDIVRPAIRSYPSQYEQRFVTKKGRVVLIRPIKPEDEPLIVDFHKRLSHESVYTRYLADIKFEDRYVQRKFYSEPSVLFLYMLLLMQYILCSVSHDRLIRVCHVDYDRDIALVVLDKSSSVEKLIAAARLTKGW